MRLLKDVLVSHDTGCFLNSSPVIGLEQRDGRFDTLNLKNLQNLQTKFRIYHFVSG